MGLSNLLKKGFTAIIILVFSHLSFSQNYELGLFAGASNYQGDLAGGLIIWKETQPAGGLFVRYSPLDFVSFKLGFTSGKFIGNDKNSPDLSIQKRGFSFTSNVRELAAFTEFHLPQYGSSSYGLFKPRFSPFIFGGVGLSMVNGIPIAPKDRTPYPFPEEGVKTQFLSIPAGVGVKFRFTESFATSLEWGTRAVFSDYLDGISKNGNPNRNDWYMFMGVTFSYVIDAGGYGSPF